MQFKVFVTGKVPASGIELLRRANIDVEVNNDPERVLARKELIETARDKDALLCLLSDKIDEEVLNAASRLKIVANYAVGFDNIDIGAATRKNIIVTNTPDVLTETVAEHAIALMMCIARRIVESDKFTRAGKYRGWNPMLFLGRDLKGKVLGIIGLGRIGRAVAERAVRGMGMNVIYQKRNRDQVFEEEYHARLVDRESLLKESDFISLHVPLTRDTKHLIGSRELELMKKSAYLINTSRGPIVEERALINALIRKRIAGAALDVFECEPEITCDEKAPIQLKDLDNVILTPHIASATLETRGRMSEMAAQSIIDFARGKKPEHVVNREVMQHAPFDIRD